MRLNATAEVSKLREGIAEELAQLASPLMTRLANVDALIAERLEDLAALREARREIVHAVRPILGEDAIPIEPGRKAKPGPGRPKERGKMAAPQVSEARVEEALTYLRANMNGDQFSRETIEKFNGLSDATGSAIIRELLKREQIRLDHVDRKHGGLRYYRLVS